MAVLDVRSFYERDHLEIKKLRHIIESSSDGIIIVDRRGLISCCNTKAAEILGERRAKLLNHNLMEIFSDQIAIRLLLDKNIRQEKQLLRWRDKELLIDFVPFEIEAEHRGATIMLHDLSSFDMFFREFRVENLLSERLDSILEYSYDGIYITDGEGNTLRINEAYERITGLKRENMVHVNMKTLVERGYISQSGSLQAIEKRKIVNISQTFKTGKKALITSKPIFDENGEIVLVVTNVRDITELFNLQSKMEEQSQLAEKYFNEAKALKKQLLDTSELVVEDKKMYDLLESAKRIAVTDITVHISGESGVGKEVIAKFVHNNSMRSEGHFIKVNCGAIPENLIESELFGYEKGAFTGAGRDGKPGLFEIADGGTLFLDEIGELPMKMQVKLLRILQDGELTRVGGTKIIKVDVRIISATNQSLERMVKEGTFRQDLYYRLNVVPLYIPPLRERKHDILKLTNHFLKLINDKYGFHKSFDRDALDALVEYQWPGNIRELKNVIDRVAIMSPNDVMTLSVLPNTIFKRQSIAKFEHEVMPLKEAIIEVEEQLLENAYERFGNVRDAAKALGIDASTFVRKRRRYLDQK